MGDPKNTLSPRDADWLAETIRRNRERFAGWRMETDPNSPPPTDPPTDPQPSDPPADPPKPPWGDDANFKPEQAWELIQNLRKEKGDPNKVTELEGKLAELQSAQQEQLDSIAKALGLKPDDTPADPAKLAQQIAEEQGKTAEATAQAAATARQVEIYRLAALGKHEANPVALLDSSSFLTSIKDVDPSDEAAVLEAVKTAIEKNPSLKATPATPPFPGGPRPPAPTQAGTLGDAIRNRVAGNR